MMFKLILFIGFLANFGNALTFHDNHENEPMIVTYSFKNNKCGKSKMAKKINHVSKKLNEVSKFISYEGSFSEVIENGFDSYFSLGDAKREEAAALEAEITLIADHCFVNDIKKRDEFKLNSEKYTEALFRLAYGMNETIFLQFSHQSAFKCISDEDLIMCEHDSFDGDGLDEFEIVPILNGSACNFNLQKMMDCYKSKMEYCIHPKVSVLQMTRYVYESFLITSKCSDKQPLNENITT